MNKDYKNSFFLSMGVHGLFFVTLLVSSFFDSPQIIRVGGGGNPEQQNKPIVHADLINHDAVKSAIDRQKQQELNKQKQLALQKANAEKVKKEAEKAKLEAQRLKQEVEEAQKKAEQEKKLALVEKESAEKAKLQAAKEKEKAKLAKEQAAQKLEKIKQEKLQAAKEQELAKKAQEQAALKRKQALAEESRRNAERARQAQELALQQAAAAERGRWIDNEFTRYVGEIERKIQENRTISTAFSPDLTCDIQIRLLPDGSVHDVKIIKSSGNAAYDAMSEAAVYRSSPFDMPEDRELMSKLRDIVLVFKVAEDGNV
jgi:colicin import membrane protein